MGKLETILLYQQTEQKKLNAEQALRSTDAFKRCTQLSAALRTRRAALQKLSDDLDQNTALTEKLNEHAKKLKERIELESGEYEIISNDEESTVEEAEELCGDIDRLSKEFNQLMREAKKLFSEIERLSEEYQKTGAVYKAEKKEYDDLRLVCEKEKEAGNAEITKIDEELKKIRASADPQYMEKYERVRQHYAEPFVQVTENCKCSGCNMSLPITTLKKLASPDAIAECENCGRILYNRN